MIGGATCDDTPTPPRELPARARFLAACACVRASGRAKWARNGDNRRQITTDIKERIGGKMTEPTEDLEQTLSRFMGTEAYHRFNPLYKTIVLTDGAKYLAEKAGAFWLMDAIASHQANPKVKAEGFQAWTLQVDESKSALLICDDGNGRVVATQAIEFTDFPLQKYSVWAIPQDDLLVILLPSEY